ncbi:hypothetical protein G9U51_15180 [Calidifontibacter sp. DB0510]|uniref:Uncharacterized protein n=1 Tax=Metallococcus carri TaxID=1656884 RepID=A0A967B319_9MICO|nr:hypothetical protein [Metallococcus carri]NHN57112.1 hypothetical protein [Metallococcus carri]NOP39019.1 hypothetical protein [Calidifontibacter sp. DB2511S]
MTLLGVAVVSFGLGIAATVRWGHAILTSIGTSGLSDAMRTMLGWLPIGGFVILIGAIILWRASGGGRALTASVLQIAAGTFWAGAAFWFLPARGSGYQSFSARLEPAGPAFVRAATWMTYLGLPLLLMTIAGGVMLRAGAGRRWIPVLALAPPLLALAALLLLR